MERIRIMGFRWRTVTVFLVTGILLLGCSGQENQAQKYYDMGKYDIALNAANKILTKDKDNVEMALLVWKIQVVAQYCDDAKSVELACSLIREKASPYGDRVIPYLKESLQEAKGCIKLFVVYTIGDVNSPEVFPILKEVAIGNMGPLEEGSITKEEIQGAALITLGQRGEEEAYQLMLDGAQSENGTLRSMATEALGYVGDESTVVLLEELLEDPYIENGKRPVALAASRSLKMITGNDYEVE
jgi:hypothetical protein